MTKVGTGTLVLSGTNTYTGTTTLSGGILAVGNDNNLGSGALTFNGGTLETTGSISSSKTVTLNPGGGTLLTDAGTISTLSGTISGAGPLTKTGAGALILSGTNSYTGTTTVSAGLLSVRGALSASAVQVASGATLGGTGIIEGTVTVLNGGILSPGNSPGTLTVGSLVLNSGSLSNFELAAPGTVGGGVNDLVAVTGNLTLAGTLNITDLGGFGIGVYRLFTYGGTLTDNIMTVGTVPGGVTPGALTIQTAIANQVNLVVNGASLLEFWDGTNAPNNGVVGGGTGTWDTTTTNWTVANGSTNSAWKQGFAVFEGAAGTVTLAENVTIGGLQFVTNGYLITTANGSSITAASGTILRAGSGVSGTIGVPIIGAGEVTKTDLGTVILSALNTYTGGTTISAGTLQLGNATTTGSIAGNIIDNGTLAFNRTDTGLNLGGNISGTGSVIQAGTGTVTLSGTSTYTGTTTVTAGTLQAGSTTGLSATSDFTVNGTLNLNGFSNTIGSLAGSGTVANNGVAAATLSAGGDNASTAFSGTLHNGTGALALIKTGTGTLILSGTNSYTGTTTVAAGTLQAGSTAGLSATSDFTVNGTLNLNGFSNTIGSLAGGGTVTNNGVGAAALSAGANNTSTTFSGTLQNGTGTLGLSKTGTGTLTLTGTNTYTGTTTIAAGTLQLGNAGATGSITGNLIDNGVLEFNRTDAALTLAGNISGTGSAIQAGTGTVTLSGTNSNTGTTTVAAGTLQAGSTTALSANSDFTVATGATLNLNGNSNAIGSLAGGGTVTNNGVATATLSAGGDNATTTFSGTLQNGTGTLGLSKTGTGTLILTGTNSYTGTTTVSAGTLRAGSSTALSATSDFAVNAILDLNGFSSPIGSLAGAGTVTNNGAAATLTAGASNASTTFSGVLHDGTGSLALTKTGTGTLILTGTNTYTNTTTVAAGRLSIRGTLSNSNVQVDSGATLSGSGSILGDVTIEPGGIFSPGNSPGTITVGSLTLNSTSVSNFELGTPGVVGGGVNDLVNVIRHLTLAGTLNIVDAGGFGAGVYRLFNYGTLTDNGLIFGTLPAGVIPADLTIQTSDPNQINLVVTTNGILFKYWDGTHVIQNGTVNGGTGTWNVANTNWTNAPGSVNSVWSPSFAVFEGAAGTVTLEANMAVSGLQFVTNGYLITTPNASVLTAAPGTILEADTGISGTVGVQITGAGDLTKTGPGTVILATTNTYTGGTAVTAGSLVVAANQALGTGAVSINGTTSLLQVNAGAGITNPLTLLNGGSVNNAGTLGGNAWGLTGISGHSTITNSGTITGQQGGITLATAGTLANTGTISGGPIEVLLAQGGTVTNAAGAMINGALTATGGSTTLTNAGTIHGNVTLSNNANLVTLFTGSQIQGLLNLGSNLSSTLVLDGAGTQTLSAAVSAGITAGQLLKQGSGTWVLDQPMTRLTGTANLIAGALEVDAELASQVVNVAQGAMIGGSGLLDGSLHNAGVLSPGSLALNSQAPGILTIKGNFSAAPTSNYLLKLASATNYTQLNVLGTASLEGTLTLSLSSGYVPSSGTQFTILRAAGGVSGKFASFINPAVLRAFLVYGPDTVTLGFLNDPVISFDSLAQTPNQRQVAKALDQIRFSATGDMAHLIAVLDSLPVAQLRAAFDQFDPRISPTMATIGFSLASTMNQQMEQHLDALRQQLTPISEKRFDTYVQSSGIFGQVNSVNDLPNYHFTTGLIQAGIDYWLSPSFALGAYAGYGYTSAGYDDGSHARLSSLILGLDATYRKGSFYLDAAAGVSINQYSLRRTIKFGSIDRAATSDPSGVQFNALLAGGYDFHRGNWTFGPLLSAEFSTLNVDSYTEQGANALNLKVANDSALSFKTNVGAHLGYDIKLSNGVRIHPELSLSWQHEFLNNDRTLRSSFAQGNGPSFGYTVPHQGRDTLISSAGVTVDFSDRWSGYAAYNGQLSSNLISHSITVGLKMNW